MREIRVIYQHVQNLLEPGLYAYGLKAPKLSTKREMDNKTPNIPGLLFFVDYVHASCSHGGLLASHLLRASSLFAWLAFNFADDLVGGAFDFVFDRRLLGGAFLGHAGRAGLGGVGLRFGGAALLGGAGALARGSCRDGLDDTGLGVSGGAASGGHC